MHYSKPLSLASRVAIFAILVSLLGVGNLDAQGRRKNPTSKLYVADVKGTAQIDTGETIDDLTKRSVYTAQGTILETKEDSTNAIVLSNGTGMYFDPSTRMEVKKFVQEPFTPNRNDMEVEPSISSTETYLSSGLVGICTSKLAAGSTMNFNTPHASIRIKGRKAVIEVSNEGTKVSLIEGDITVRGGTLDAGGQTLTQGQQALIKPDGTIEIRDIPANELISIGEKASMACMARKTVYFDVKGNSEAAGEENSTAFDEAAGAGDEIVAIEVTPTDISPEVTVSAASIPRSN
jgi:hypothetical protein